MRRAFPRFRNVFAAIIVVVASLFLTLPVRAQSDEEQRRYEEWKEREKAKAGPEFFDPVSVLGPAPVMPWIAPSEKAGIPCDEPAIAGHTRCKAWLEATEAWQEKARALMEEHARTTPK